MTQTPAQTDLPSQASPDSPAATTPATTEPQHTMKPTRTSMVWTMVAVLLGALLVLTAGAARVLQLRRVARRHRRADQLS